MKDVTTLAVIEASAIRRFLGGFALLGSAVLLFLAAFNSVENPLWQAVVAMLGVGVLVVTDKFRRATARRIDLTSAGLFEDDGTCVVKLQDVASVERGMLAFKPSNGFVIHTTAPTSPVWRPGLWWRFGTRVGIGGVVSQGQSRFMVDTLEQLVRDRDQL